MTVTTTKTIQILACNNLQSVNRKLISQQMILVK